MDVCAGYAHWGDDYPYFCDCLFVPAQKQTTTVKLESYALDYSSMVYTQNEKGENVKYLTLYSTEDVCGKIGTKFRPT